MEIDWTRIYTTPDLHKATIIAASLKELEIETVLVNKQDSSYQMFGECELFVRTEDFQHALEIIIRNDIE